MWSGLVYVEGCAVPGFVIIILLAGGAYITCCLLSFIVKAIIPPIIKNKIAAQSNLCTMEPAVFLHEIIKLAEEMNKFKQFSTTPKEPAEKKKDKEDENTKNKPEEKPKLEKK